MKPRKISTGVRTHKQEGEQWQRNSNTPKSMLYQQPVVVGEPNNNRQPKEGDNNNNQQQLMAQQLLMLLPGANGNTAKQTQQDEQQIDPLNGASYQGGRPLLVPPTHQAMGLPPGTAAELGALLFADVVRKQLMEQAAGEIVGPQQAQLDLMYRHLAKNQPSPMILSTSDIANKASPIEPLPNNNGDSPLLNALQYDAFPNQRFNNNHPSAFTSFINGGSSGLGPSASIISEPRPSTSNSSETSSNGGGVLEIDARALLAAFLHCLTSDLKRSNNNSTNSDGTGSDSTPISVESDEDMPPNNGGKPNGKNRTNQQRRTSLYASGSSEVFIGDNNASPKSSEGVNISSCNSSSSSSTSSISKRSTKAGSNVSGVTPEREGLHHQIGTANSSTSSSPPVNGNSGLPGNSNGHGESSETAVQELIEEATTMKQQQQETSSKGSVNESEPFYWVQSFHAFERRNLIRTCLMQPPSQMTFDARRQCFRRVPAVTLYRCNVCGDYTSKHRDKISRHLTLQHSIKPTSPPMQSSQSSPSNAANNVKSGQSENDGGHFGGTEIDTVPGVSYGNNIKNANVNKAPGEVSPTISSISASNSSPTWPVVGAVGTAGQTPTISHQQSVFQWPPLAAANRLPLAITTDPRTLMLAANNSNSQSSNGAPIDLTSTNNNSNNNAGVKLNNGEQTPGRTLLTVGGIIETAFYQAAAASSSSPSPPLSINNETSNSSSPAKKMKPTLPITASASGPQSTVVMNGLDLSSAGGSESAFKRVRPNNNGVVSAITVPVIESNNNNNPANNKQQREFPCHYCPATFRLYVALRTHYAQQHPATASARPYNCNICDFSTTQLRKLDQHQQQHHQSKQPPARPAIEQAVQKI